MKKSILVTGISGVGKSTVSKKLNDMGYKAYDMDAHPDLFSMIDKKTGLPVVDHDNGNLEKVKGIDWICDIEKLKSIISSETRELAFYCGNASNIDAIVPLFDKVILLKIKPEVMRQRLTTRTENDYGRTHEVQDWLETWKDWWEDSMQKKGALFIDASDTLDEVAKNIIASV